MNLGDVQSGYGQEDAPGGHKTLGSEKSLDLAEDARVTFLQKRSIYTLNLTQIEASGPLVKCIWVNFRKEPVFND